MTFLRPKPHRKTRVASVRIVACRMAGGRDHEHIVEVRWVDEEAQKSGSWTRELVLAWLDAAKGSAYLLGDDGRRIAIGTRHPLLGARFIQAFEDPVWTDDLLSLPSYGHEWPTDAPADER